jgi:hypothetical protein
MSAGIAALIAHVAFWVLLAFGWFWEDVGRVGLTILLLLWLAGWFGLPLVPYGDGLLTSYVAVLDIVLVFIVFKSDVKLT